MQVAYKETIQKPAEAEGKYIKQSGGRGQYGHVWIKFEPLSVAKDMNLIMMLLVEQFQENLFLAVEKGLEEAHKQVFLVDIL